VTVHIQTGYKLAGFWALLMSLKTTQPYLFTPWSTILLEKLTVPQILNKYPAFIEPKGSSTHSQQPTTCPYP
jgi:hypothetical protein